MRSRMTEPRWGRYQRSEIKGVVIAACAVIGVLRLSNEVGGALGRHQFRKTRAPRSWFDADGASANVWFGETLSSSAKVGCYLLSQECRSIDQLSSPVHASITPIKCGHAHRELSPWKRGASRGVSG